MKQSSTLTQLLIEFLSAMRGSLTPEVMALIFENTARDQHGTVFVNLDIDIDAIFQKIKQHLPDRTPIKNATDLLEVLLRAVERSPSAGPLGSVLLETVRSAMIL